jgi:hypothetical protein
MTLHRCASHLCSNYIRDEDSHVRIGLLYFCGALCASVWSLQNKVLNEAADRWTTHRKAAKKWWLRM